VASPFLISWQVEKLKLKILYSSEDLYALGRQLSSSSPSCGSCRSRNSWQARRPIVYEDQRLRLQQVMVMKCDTKASSPLWSS
jgi:uncharacterized UBP type Zn finger protein